MNILIQYLFYRKEKKYKKYSILLLIYQHINTYYTIKYIIIYCVMEIV